MKNRLGAPCGKKAGPGGSGGALGRENDTKITEKTNNFDAEDVQKKASIPPCLFTFVGDKTSGTVQNVPQTLQTTGDAVVIIGTVAVRPKAIGYVE